MINSSLYNIEVFDVSNKMDIEDGENNKHVRSIGSKIKNKIINIQDTYGDIVFSNNGDFLLLRNGLFIYMISTLDGKVMN